MLHVLSQQKEDEKLARTVEGGGYMSPDYLEGNIIHSNYTCTSLLFKLLIMYLYLVDDGWHRVQALLKLIEEGKVPALPTTLGSVQ